MQTAAQARGLEIVAGADRAWPLRIRDAKGNLVTSYTGAATLAAQVWAGDAQAALFAPSLTWTDPTVGKVLLSITAAQSATLQPNLTYGVMLSITAGSVVTKREIAGGLKVLRAPGSGVARPVYISADEMMRHAGHWADALQRLDVDQSGFAEERADTREELDELIHAHDRGASVLLGSAATGYTPWTSRRFGFKDPYLQAKLDAGGLILTRRIKEFCSLWALGIVAARQAPAEKGKGYMPAAAYFRRRADDIAGTLTCEIDYNGDGVADKIVHLGTVDRIRG